MNIRVAQIQFADFYGMVYAKFNASYHYEYLYRTAGNNICAVLDIFRVQQRDESCIRMNSFIYTRFGLRGFIGIPEQSACSFA